MLDKSISDTQTETVCTVAVKDLKPYTKPILEKLGDLRTLTLGISGGSLESGSGDNTHRLFL